MMSDARALLQNENINQISAHVIVINMCHHVNNEKIPHYLTFQLKPEIKI